MSGKALEVQKTSRAFSMEVPFSEPMEPPITDPMELPISERHINSSISKLWKCQSPSGTQKHTFCLLCHRFLLSFIIYNHHI